MMVLLAIYKPRVFKHGIVRTLICLISMVVAFAPYRVEAQESATVGRELTFICNSIDEADIHLLPSGNSCDMSEAMNLLVELMTSNRYANIPLPTNYVEYFGGIPEDVIAYPMWYAGEEDSERHKTIADYYAAIEALQEYAEGRRETLPLEQLMRQVRRALCAYDDAIYEGVCIAAPYRLLAYRLLEQIVLLAPSIDMVATSVNAERTLAILDTSSSTYYMRPVLCPIFIYDKYDNIWRVIMHSDMAPRSVAEIEDVEF